MKISSVFKRFFAQGTVARMTVKGAIRASLLLVSAFLFATVHAQSVVEASAVEKELQAKEKIIISDAWLRFMPPVSNSVAYFTLQNNFVSAVKIIGATSTRFGGIEMHTTETVNGLKKMHRLREVEVAGKSQIIFKPGAKHLMLFRMTTPLVEGEIVQFLLHIEGKKSVPFAAQVRR